MADRLVALVLAAGRSTRFGGDKLLADVGGKSLGAHVADTLVTAGIARRIAVCPAHVPERAALYSARGFEVIANPSPERGLASSLALGAGRAIELDADRLLVCLADMPFVTARHLRTLIAVSETAGLVATAAGGVRTPPAIFGSEHLPLLRTLSGDQGARDLLRQAVPVDAEAAILRDVDTPADLQ